MWGWGGTERHEASPCKQASMLRRAHQRRRISRSKDGNLTHCQSPQPTRTRHPPVSSALSMAVHLGNCLVRYWTTSSRSRYLRQSTSQKATISGSRLGRQRERGTAPPAPFAGACRTTAIRHMRWHSSVLPERAASQHKQLRSSKSGGRLLRVAPQAAERSGLQLIQRRWHPHLPITKAMVWPTLEPTHTSAVPATCGAEQRRACWEECSTAQYSCCLCRKDARLMIARPTSGNRQVRSYAAAPAGHRGSTDFQPTAAPAAHHSKHGPSRHGHHHRRDHQHHACGVHTLQASRWWALA